MREIIKLEGFENLEISEEQVNTLVFAISSKDIKKYIEENEEEYEDWLAEVYFTELIFGKPA